MIRSEVIKVENTTKVSSTILNPSAPVFVPSIASGAAITTAIITTNDSTDNIGQDNCEIHLVRYQNSVHKSEKQNNQKKCPVSRTKKREHQLRGKYKNKTSNSDSKIKYVSNNDSELDSSRRNTKNRSYKVDNIRKSKTSCNKKCCKGKQHPMKKPKSNFEKTEKRKCLDLPSHECPIQRDYDERFNTEKVISEPHSLLEFPALREKSSSSPLLAEKTKWNIRSGLQQVREEALQHGYSTGKKQDVLKDQGATKWQNGLDLLTSHSRRRNRIHLGHQQLEYLSWDDKDHTEEKQEKQSECNDREHHDEINQKTLLSKSEMIMISPTNDPKNSHLLGKRIVDMNRLRNRWWSAIANQKLHIQERQTMLRAQQERKKSDDVDTKYNNVYDDVDEGIQNNYCCGDSKDSSGGSKSQNCDAHFSILQEEVRSNVPFDKLTSGKLILLEKIIEQSDVRALRDLVELSWNLKNKEKHLLERRNPHFVTGKILSYGVIENERIEGNGVNVVEHAISIVIHRNYPKLLSTILSVTGGRVPIHLKPLLLAVQLGHEECASLLLSRQENGSSMLLLKDNSGNTALHYCCEENGSEDMLCSLLKHTIGNSKAKRLQLSKLVTSQNKMLQTPLHIACQSGRNDLVEVFLASCKTPLLFKILSMKDIKHQTPMLCAVSSNSQDVVLSLLMWRRNHNRQRRKEPPKYSVSLKTIGTADNQKQISKVKNMACPLVLAAKCGNLEMIDLLIQFGDSSVNSHNVTQALSTLLRSEASSEIKLNGSYVLIVAGGNPFEEIACSGSAAGEKETCISIGTTEVCHVIIRSIICTALRILNDRQLARRRDPILQQQPEVFFDTLESKENSEAKTAIQGALRKALFRAYSNQKPWDFRKAIVLYEQIEEVEEECIVQLYASLRDEPASSNICRSNDWSFLATYRHRISAVANEGSKSNYLLFDRSLFAEKSFHLLRLPWVQSELLETECYCPWIKRNVMTRHLESNHAVEDLLGLIANDDSRFLVHAQIASKKSGKLASALEFAQMRRCEDSIGEVTNIELDIAPDFCQLLIQHIYHGSICFGWPNLEDDEMCRYLLELMIVADELLIPSLVEEIEMRLLSSNPKRCCCWDCCHALRLNSSNNGDIEGQCLYIVNGSSCLVNRNTAMDVLRLTEFMGGMGYEIFITPSTTSSCVDAQKLWTNYERETKKLKFWDVSKALASLRDIAIITILKEFAYIVKTSDFCLTTGRDLNGQECQKQKLLQLCMDNLRNNSIIAMSYHRFVEKTSSLKTIE